MNTNLVMYDVDQFLNKYTRFMTKDVYISKMMYDNFLKPYNYLYEKLTADAILYRENSKYKKMFEIKEKKEQVLRLHNQKYLKKNLNNYSSFFDSLKIDGVFDNNQKSIILSNEDKMLVINNKNVDALIIGKVKYLVDILKIKKNKILVLTNDSKNLNELFKDNNLETITVATVKSYIKDLLGDKTLVGNNDKYNILLNYIMNDLFKDKEKFKILYETFSNNIYLNKDYKDYDTFSDYHSYMYKRMFLSSKLSLNRFVDKEINKRMKYLRTIKNELVQTVEEVLVANYLCTNGVSYKYITNEHIFLIGNNKNSFKIKVINENEHISNKDNYNETIIYINIGLVKIDAYKEIIKDEIKERAIKKKELQIEDIYDLLKNSMIDNYFSEFINKYLIKYLDYYDLNNSFENTKLNQQQINILKDIYLHYKQCLAQNKFVTKGEISSMLENSLNSKNYKYIIINSDISLNLNSSILKIVDDYKEVELIRENIKLLYDYKRYLHDNKLLNPINTYIDELEIAKLTTGFLKKNLSVINDYFMNSKKKISIHLYDDSNKLLINKNIAKECYEIVRKNKDILIGVNDINNVNTLVYKDSFVKIDRKRLSINPKTTVDCEEILKIRKSYDKVILPFLIVDSYHEDLTISDNNYNIKLMIYISLSKCKNELILLCPKGKKKELTSILKKIKNISIFE